MGDSDQQAAYAITDKERFLFDLNGFVVRPGILEADEIAAIRDQIYRLRYDRDSLPATERAILGGSSSVLINHPAVLGIVKSVINSEVRIEHSYSVWRERGESHEAPFHRGGPKSIQADPIFGYRCDNGRIYAGMVRVVIELTDIDETNGGGTWFIPGSHKANCEIPSDFLEPDQATRMPYARSYSCPAGSAVFFTENVSHAGPTWERHEPRVAVLSAYSHLATHWHKLNIPPAVIAALPREKQAYFRDTWSHDFSERPVIENSYERFVADGSDS